MKTAWRQRLRKKCLAWLRPGQNEEELLTLVQRAECIQSDEQRRMLVQAVEFHDTRVREIMTPRSKVHAIDIKATADEIEYEIIHATATRLPVTNGDLDHILGVVHVWDLFAAKIKQQNINLQALIRPCPQVSELQRVEGLLSEMREGSHIAIVQDEFGGTAGLVTLSDLLEEIVGSIDEDNNVDDADIIRSESGSFDVLANVHVEELASALNMRLPTGDFDTVGGLITSEIGRIPFTGESFNVAMLHIKIVQADPRRILRVLITPLHT
ncbi:MAG: hemolysin family protein [Mariprofundaceae bacterium]|nr:hemolysin family protein [Mariprofundaceae bacterium]